MKCQASKCEADARVKLELDDGTVFHVCETHSEMTFEDMDQIAWKTDLSSKSDEGDT